MKAFSPKQVAEIILLTVDWAVLLHTNETIVAASCTITVESGPSSSPMATSGLVTISSSETSVLVTGGEAGARYLLTWSIDTSLGATIVEEYTMAVS